MSKDPRLEDLEKEGRRPEAEQKVLKNFFSYFRRHKSRLKFGEKLETMYEWLTSGRLSARDKAIVIGALIYFINPLDLIPDLTPFLGFSDDFGVIYLVFNYIQNRALQEKHPDAFIDPDKPESDKKDET